MAHPGIVKTAARPKARPAAQRIASDILRAQRELDQFQRVRNRTRPGAAVLPSLEAGIAALRAHLADLAAQAARAGLKPSDVGGCG